MSTPSSYDPQTEAALERFQLGAQQDGAPDGLAAEVIVCLSVVYLMRRFVTTDEDDWLSGRLGDMMLLRRAHWVQAILADSLCALNRLRLRLEQECPTFAVRVVPKLVSACEIIPAMQNELRRRVAPFYSSGHPIACMFVLSDTASTEEQKTTAAADLARGSFARPIPSQRWGRFKQQIVRELHQRAGNAEQSPEMALQTAVIQAIFLTVAQQWQPITGLYLTVDGKRRKLSNFGGRNEPALFDWYLYWPWFRQEVADAVCEDLLGPSWRNDPDHTAQVAAEPISLEEAQRELENRLELEEAVSQCTPSQQALLDLLLEGYTLAEAAQQLGLASSTARVHMLNIRKKLQAARDK
ncbi:MAG: LuxR C-terminal-related transcriptional regulator [Bacteroidetes bacterium]|nr:LuxR C-terminal-related transcriptional regulator [Bacteroidota bacterium]